MNKDKKMQISKKIAFEILTQLKNQGCFDGFITRFFTYKQCINHLGKIIPQYFKDKKQLVNWNKDSWFNIFDDNDLVSALVFYMQEYNLAKEIEEQNDK